MPLSMKRPAAQSTEVPVDKAAKKEKPVKVPKRETLIVSVAKGLVQTEIPEDVRNMLDEALDLSLGIFADQRHKFMQEIVDIVGGIFQGHIDSYKMNAAGFQKFIDEGESKREAQEASVQKLESDLNSYQSVVFGKVQELAAVAKEFADAKLNVKKQETEIADADREKSTSQEQRQQLESAMADIFHPLCENGVCGDASLAQANLLKLSSTLSAAGFDGSMVNTLSNVLMKDIVNRGSFDIMVLGQVKTEVADRMAKFNNFEQNFSKAKAELESTLAEMNVVFEKAKKEQMIKSTELVSAQKEESEVLQKVNDAKDELNATRKDIRGFAKELGVVTRRLTNFTEGPFAAFETLRDRSTPTVDEVPAQQDDVDMAKGVDLQETDTLVEA